MLITLVPRFLVWIDFVFPFIHIRRGRRVR